MKEGWLCPRCGTINAPFIGHCECKPNTIKENTNVSKTVDISECSKGNHDWKFIGSVTGGSQYRCKRCGQTKLESVDCYI